MAGVSAIVVCADVSDPALRRFEATLIGAKGFAVPLERDPSDKRQHHVNEAGQLPRGFFGKQTFNRLTANDRVLVGIGHCHVLDHTTASRASQPRSYVRGFFLRTN